MSYLNVSLENLNHAGDETLKRYIESSSYEDVIKEETTSARFLIRILEI